jgi:polar amino acid transport system substrate-binding protein
MQQVRSKSRSGYGARIAAFAIPVLALALPLAMATPSSAAGTLDRIKGSSAINLGYRADARPFAYRDDAGNAAGYSVELCQKIADQVKSQLGLDKLTVNWVPVTLEDRFTAVAQGKIDLLCGADTATLTRRKDVSFSLPIFPSGVGAVLRTDAPLSLQEVLSNATPSRPVWRGSPARTVLNEQTFSVIAGTTAERWLNDRAATLGITASIVKVDSYDAGINGVLDGSANVFFGDRPILLDAARRSPSGRSLVVLDRFFTHENLALAMARGDEDFRLAVDTALSRVFGSPDFNALYTKWFGDEDESTRAFFQQNILTE